MTFYSLIDTSHGLSDNQIRYIQLPTKNGITTTQNVNLYDGANLPLCSHPEYIYPLKQYKGFYHVYLSGDSCG